MLLGLWRSFCLLLKRSNRLLEMENLPESNTEVQEADAGNSATHPAGSNHSLQTLHSSLARSVEQKVIVTPVAQPPHSLWPPWQHGQEETYFQAQDNVEDNAKFSRHFQATTLSYACLTREAYQQLPGKKHRSHRLQYKAVWPAQNRLPARTHWQVRNEALDIRLLSVQARPVPS